MQSLFTLALFLAGVSGMPQGIGTGSNTCPPGCSNMKTTENDHADPHQLYFLQQMTGNHQCGHGAGCEISKSEVEGTSVGINGGISADGWISAGFEVSKYEESGEVQTCYGEPGDTICVFWRTAHTSYTVTAQAMKCCQNDGKPYDKVLTSPNKNDLGSGAICGRNEQCHTKGHSYWNNMERHNGGSTKQGGPQEWPFGDEVSGIVPDYDELPPAKTD